MKEKITKKQLASMIDHTNLKPFATRKDLKKLCDEADENGFAMVAINSGRTEECAMNLAESETHVGAAIAFPLGQMDLPSKLAEAENAIKAGADEIDYVIRVDKVKDGNYSYIRDEMIAMKDLCHEHDVICKVIFETCYLSDDEIIQLAQIARDVRPDFIKTSTGFGTAGATAGHVKLMKENAGNEVGVKAAGGIRTLKDALAMIDAGATRLGTSASLAILGEMEDEDQD